MVKTKDRVRYEIDPHNRLIISKAARKSEIPKYRYTVDGRFKIDSNNYLIYHVKKAKDYKVPQQIKFLGNWSLDKKHNLVLALNKWSNQIAGNKLTIKGRIIDVKSNELMFAVTTRNPEGAISVYVLKLSGWWQVNEGNRLSFTVEKEKGSSDTLTLEGAWSVNQHNQLIYKYIKRDLKTKQRRSHTLIFKGYWDITEKFRLSYILDKKLNSVFDFKTSLGVPLSKGGKRGLKYEVGIALKKAKRLKEQSITIFGNWRIDEKRGLLFEVEYGRNNIHAILFGADIRLDEKNILEVRLKNEKGKDLGIKLTFSRRILRDCGEVFIKALSSKKELAIYVGTGLIW